MIGCSRPMSATSYVKIADAPNLFPEGSPSAVNSRLSEHRRVSFASPLGGDGKGARVIAYQGRLDGLFAPPEHQLIPIFVVRSESALRPVRRGPQQYRHSSLSSAKGVGCHAERTRK